jgi:hypothetical protein
MDLGEIPLIQFMVHQTCPAAIPQKKKFSIHSGFSDLSVYPVFMQISRSIPMKVLAIQELRNPQNANNVSD